MSEAEVVVAGHICLDIIPSLEGLSEELAQLLRPGGLVKVGPAQVGTGGVVANTGLALHRLGVAARLMGKVGDDHIGRTILAVLRAHAPSLADDMIVAPGEHSSYTIVISPPGRDRMFLHCPGANDTFGAADVPAERTAGARIFHFGYPPLMRRMYSDGSEELARLLAAARGRGAAVSMDVSQPDPESEAGRADWTAVLARALPHVNLYMPSLEETLFMLDRPRFDARAEGAPPPDTPLIAEMADRLLAMGAAVVGLKLGERGLYLRTSDDGARMAAVGGRLGLDAPAWRSRELLAPCFRVEVAGTPGAGDTTVAGFLAALLRGLGPEDALRTAVAVGACSVERPDATSGVSSWDAVQRRIAAGWSRRETDLELPGWRVHETTGILRGPNDGGPAA